MHCRHDPPNQEKFPGIHGHQDRPQTRLGDAGICGGCHTVDLNITYVPCLECTGVGEYARFYNEEELRWWSDQYREHGCPGLATQQELLLEILVSKKNSQSP